MNRQPIKDYTPKSQWDCNHYQSSPRVRKIRDIMYLVMLPTVMFIAYYGVQILFGVRP